MSKKKKKGSKEGVGAGETKRRSLSRDYEIHMKEIVFKALFPLDQSLRTLSEKIEELAVKIKVLFSLLEKKGLVSGEESFIEEEAFKSLSSAADRLGRMPGIPVFSLYNFSEEEKC